jgi:osmotically inducible protein OsmC
VSHVQQLLSSDERPHFARVTVARGAGHEPPRESDLHRQSPHDWRSGRRFAQRRRAPRGQAVEARTPGAGTNPEQLFAAGWSACYESSMELVARRMKIVLPADLAVDAEVDLGPNGDAYDVAVRLNISLPGVEPDVARRLVDATHHVCPYSRATHGNILVETKLV